MKMESVDLGKVVSSLNKLRMMRASLEGRQNQLKSQLETQLMPEFEKLGVTPDTIEETLRVEEEDMLKSYNKIHEIVSSVNSNIEL